MIILKARWMRFFALLFICPGIVAAWNPEKTKTSSDIELALEKLNVVGSVLYFAAHPDDENTAMLAWFENEKHLRAGYLSITRGDGGQNLIGTEKGDLLGVIRTQELLAARRIDGGEQFFTRAIDFGYSKTAEESMEFWGREETLADAVLVIRQFRPDVIVTRFPGDGRGGHGHHTASAILAGEAVEAAADPSRFPDQLSALKPWKVKRLFWNFWSWGEGPTDEERESLIEIDLGSYEPLLGLSQMEIAALSRSQHKCQGFGSAGRRGTAPGYLEQQAGDRAAEDPFEGIDMTWGRIPGGERIGGKLEEILEEFDTRNPSASIPALVEVRGMIAALYKDGTGEFGSMVLHKTDEVDDLIRASAGLHLLADASVHSAAPGASFTIAASAINRSEADIRLDSIVVSAGNPTINIGRPLEENKPVVENIEFTVPQSFDWRNSQPYWLRQPAGKGRFTVRDRELVGSAENGPLIRVSFFIEVNGQPIEYRIPVVYGWVDRVDGELYRPVRILPAATLSFDRSVYLFPDNSSREISLTVDAADSLAGDLSLRLPEGWVSEPPRQTVEMAANGRRTVRFTVTPPAAAAEASVTALLQSEEGAKYGTEVITIDYPHIPIQTVLRDAGTKFIRFDLERTGEEIAYIAGSGDDIPSSLEQAGYKVTELTEEDVAFGDLTRFDAIVTGIRAFNTRDDLLRQHHRLLAYIEQGGTLVAQYNTAGYFSSPLSFGPYPFTLGRERVTVEEAPVELLDRDISILNYPNRITEADFDGWVQERGLYFASEWDAAYTAPLACHDPDEPDRAGGLLVASYGKGVFIYTGYSFFRQLPAGVPGAFRLFVNLVSARGGSLSP